MKKAPVTDHAFVRYLERVLGHDVEEMKRYMVTPNIKAAIGLGATSVCVDGVTYKIKGRKIVTIQI